MMEPGMGSLSAEWLERKASGSRALLWIGCCQKEGEILQLGISVHLIYRRADKIE